MNNQCRICHCELIVTNNINCTKCNCTGTIGNIHDSCLIEFMKYKKENKCEICNEKYIFSKYINLELLIKNYKYKYNQLLLLDIRNYKNKIITSEDIKNAYEKYQYIQNRRKIFLVLNILSFIISFIFKKYFLKAINLSIIMLYFREFYYHNITIPIKIYILTFIKNSTYEHGDMIDKLIKYISLIIFFVIISFDLF